MRVSLPSEQQLTVLAVDDNPDTLHLFSRYAANTRYNVIGVRQPVQVVAVAEKVAPQIVVLDVMLPEVDGWQLLGQLRAHPALERVPIIVCTILPQERLARALGARRTDLQHFGEDRDAFQGSITPPIFRTSLFSFPDCEALAAGFGGGGRDLYSRVSNPTVRALEVKIAALEAADQAIAFASGMGAISAVLLTFLRRGDHLVCCAGAYGPTLSLAHRLERDWGIELTLVPPRDTEHRGVLATRSPHRPNPIGLTAARIVSVRGREVVVAEHDLLDGTPVLDLKPYLPYCDSVPDAKLGYVDDLRADAADHREWWGQKGMPPPRVYRRRD